MRPEQTCVCGTILRIKYLLLLNVVELAASLYIEKKTVVRMSTNVTVRETAAQITP